MSKNFRFITGVLSLMLCFAAMAFGQGTTGSVEGTVKDANGAVVPNATVTVESSGTTAGFRRSVTADASGYVNIPNVPPGTHTVTVTATNFAVRTQQITVVVDRATTLDAVLQVVGVTGVVDVTADTSVSIDPTDTTVDTNITKQVINALPKGAGFSSLLKVAPNVRPEPLAAGFQIDGASGAENVFVIDGQEVTNFRTGQLNSNNNVPFELVQEVQVKSTGFGAEYGGATGGVINVVTIGGNDEWRGNFGLAFDVPTFNGSNRPIVNNYNPVTDGTGAFENFLTPKDQGTDFFPSAGISGPIIKGKLWFSAVYAPQFFSTIRSIDYYGSATPANPNTRFVTESIQYRAEQKTEQAFVRLDAQPHSRLRMSGSFLYNPIIVKGAVPALTEGFSAVPQQADFGGSVGLLRGAAFLDNQGGRQNSNNVNGQIAYTATDKLLLNFRVGRSFLNEKLGSYGIPNATRYNCSVSGDPALIPGGSAAAGCVRGYNNFVNNFQIAYDVSTRTTFDADAALVGVNLGGRHNFKFGYQLNKLFNTVDQGYANTGILQLFYGLPINAVRGGLTPTPGNLGSGRLQRFGTVGEASSKNQALFAQDSWQIGNRLTLNLGVRIENETVPSFGEGGQAIEFGWGDKIAPRLGVAFDVTGSGKTKIFASYGWFYDRFKYELPRGSFGGDFFRRDYFEILPTSQGRSPLFSFYTVANILGGAPDVIGGACPTSGVGFSVCQDDFRIATNLAGADIFETGAVDPDLKAARQSEYTVGLEHQLFRNAVLGARYTHKQVDFAVEDVGVFNAQGSEAYIIGNPGFGLTCDISTDAGRPCTKAERTYDALEVRFDKRATNWFVSGSYTLSRLFGNYSGLASSDEFGRSSPNVNRFFDLPFLGYTAAGQEPENGRLATDRPHVFKAFGGYTHNWGGNNTNATTVSAFTTVQSGTPLTTIYSLYSVSSAILYGRGDLGRTEMFTETDINIAHRYRFGRDNRFSLEPFVSIRNIFNESNNLAHDTTISSTNFSASTLRTGGCPTTVCGASTDSGGFQENRVIDAILLGGGIQQYVESYLTTRPAGSVAGQSVTYGVPNTFQGPRDVRFGARFFF